MAEIWKLALNVEYVDMADSFLDLGGSSVQVARMLSLVEQSFGVAFAPPVLLTRSSLAQLSEAVYEARAALGSAARPSSGPSRGAATPGDCW